MKKYNLILLITLVTSINIFASGGSIYTRYGVGDIINSSSSRLMSLGGLGYALQNSDYLSDLNPANWHKIYATRLEANFLLNGINLDDGIKKSNYSKGIFNGLKIGIPIERDLGIAMVMGVSPETFVQYEVVNSVSNSSIENYTTTYEGNGGINRLFWGVSYKLPFDFVLGASFDYYMGKIRYNSIITFASNSEYNNSSIRKQREYKGIGYNIGLLSPDLNKIFKIDKIQDLRLGVAFKYVSNVKTDTSLYIGSLLGEKLVEKIPVYTHLPYKIGLGISFIFDQNYLFIIDYANQPWSEYRFNNQKDPNLRNYQKISLGVEHRNSVTRFSTFAEQIILRGGIGYEQTQYKINGTGIDYFYLTAGLSLPLMFENTVDIGVTAGLRGKKENALIKETVYNLSISFSFGELWFIRQDR
jgi:hypothetical protein